MTRRGSSTWLGAALLLAAVGPAQEVPASRPAQRALPIPAGPGALAPSLSSRGGRLWLSWLEPAAAGAPGHRLMVAPLAGAAFGAPRRVAEEARMFANWADLPSVVIGEGDAALAHWLVRRPGGRYAYDVHLARSADGGATWARLGALHDDGTATEHGFVTLVPDGPGFTAVWLDGRAMASGGAMALRAAPVDDAVGEATVLDADVCTCCQTDAVRVGEVLVVVYRDHEQGERRDISVVRRTADNRWSPPAALHDDGWRIGGCPVNGPAAAAADGLLAVAWFTAALDRPRVLVAFSTDAGASFGDPVVLDADRPLGRVDVVCTGDGAVVSWLGRSGERSPLRLAYVGASGRRGAPRTVAETASARASGFPRLARIDDELVVVWREPRAAPPLRGARLAIGALRPDR